MYKNKSRVSRLPGFYVTVFKEDWKLPLFMVSQCTKQYTQQDRKSDELMDRNKLEGHQRLSNQEKSKSLSHTCQL